jgi:hypothetical protein
MEESGLVWWLGGTDARDQGKLRRDPSVVLLLAHDLKGLANETIKVTGGPSYERFPHIAYPCIEGGAPKAHSSITSRKKLTYLFLPTFRLPSGCRFARAWPCSE